MARSEHDEDPGRDLEAIATRLEAERPVPSASFHAELRRQLLRGPVRRRLSRREALVLVAAYAGSGLALLAIASIGLTGVGPLAP